MLYSSMPPSIASISCMLQFLELFPWVRLCVGSSTQKVTEQRKLQTESRNAVITIGGEQPQRSSGHASWNDWTSSSPPSWNKEERLLNHGSWGSSLAQMNGSRSAYAGVGASGNSSTAYNKPTATSGSWSEWA